MMSISRRAAGAPAPSDLEVAATTGEQQQRRPGGPAAASSYTASQLLPLLHSRGRLWVAGVGLTLVVVVGLYAFYLASFGRCSLPLSCRVGDQYLWP